MRIRLEFLGSALGHPSQVNWINWRDDDQFLSETGKWIGNWDTWADNSAQSPLGVVEWHSSCPLTLSAESTGQSTDNERRGYWRCEASYWHKNTSLAHTFILSGDCLTSDAQPTTTLTLTILWARIDPCTVLPLPSTLSLQTSHSSQDTSTAAYRSFLRSLARSATQTRIDKYWIKSARFRMCRIRRTIIFHPQWYCSDHVVLPAVVSAVLHLPHQYLHCALTTQLTSLYDEIIKRMELV